MTAGLETFAKVRALHDRTDIPGEKAAAANRMEALARAAGMTTAEAVSKLDSEAARQAAGGDWSDLADALRRAAAAGAAADAPEARSQRYGLPIYNPSKVEPWRDVAEHCLGLDWIVPKACGGKFLTKAERERLKVIARHYGLVTNADAAWIETVLARCETARTTWRDRGKAGVRPDPKATESDIEKAAEIVAAAKRRETSKLDTAPKAAPRPSSQAQATADAFNEFFNRPEFVAERNEREARRRVEAAAIIERYGSEDALFEDTLLEAALRAACEPLLGVGEDWDGSYSLDGWGSFGTRRTMPASVREAVSRAWPLPATVAEAWTEYEAADRLMGERCTVEYTYEPHTYVEARRYVVEEICNTLPARSLNDLRARGAWLAFQADAEVSQRPDEHCTLIATLRADIERMGARLREQDAATVQTGQPPRPRQATAENSAAGFSPDPGKTPTPVQTGQRPSTRAERRAAARALLSEGLTDREIARRVGISPTTVGSLRRVAS